MADYNLGTANGRIRTTYDGSGVRSAENDLQRLQKENKRAKASFGDVAAGAGAASLAIAVGLGYAANTAIQFEKQISAIGAVSGATKDDLELLRKKALELGSNTAFSASEAAMAMEELAKAGIATKDILNGAADAAVALAAAGGIDLAEAAEIAANAMGQFNLEAKHLGEVVDIIAGAANSSAISVTDFNESMKQAGAVANLAGLSFEDLAVAIALMGRNGIKGSDAGTSLKTMLSNLQPSTKKQADEFKRLGIITSDGSNRFYDAAGNIKNLADISGILADATKNMTAQQKQATLEILFGSDAIRAAAILTKNGAAGFNEMNAAINKTKAADVAAARLDNVAGSIEQLKGALETAAITIGTLFLPVIRKVAEFITMLTNKFNNLDPKWQKLIGFALAGAAALLGIVSAIAAAGFAAIGLGAALGAIKIAAVVSAIVAGIAAIVAGLALLWKRSESFRTAVGTIFATVSDHIKRTRAVIQPFIDFIKNELLPMLKNGFLKGIENLKPAFDAISKFVTEKVAPALAEFRSSLQEAMPTIIKIAKFIGTVLVGAWDKFTKVIAFVVPILAKIAGVVFPAIVSVVSWLIRNIPNFVKGFQTFINVIKTIGKIIAIAVIGPFYLLYQAVKWVIEKVVAAVQWLWGIWQSVWSFFAPVVQAVWGLITSILSAVWAGLQASFQIFKTVITAIWSTLWNAVMAVVRPVWDFIKSVITGVMDFLSPYLSAAWNAIKSVITTVVDAISNAVSVAWNWIKTTSSTVWNAIKSVISVVWEAIKSLIKSAVDRVISIINGIKTMVDNVKKFFNQLKDAASGGTGSLIEFVKGIPGKILDQLKNLGTLLVEKGKALVQGLIDGIKAKIGALASAAKNLANTITDFLPGSPAKKGPLSGRGYVKFRGEHLAEDFSLGIVAEAGAAKAAVEKLITDMATVLPSPQTAAANQQSLLAASVPGMAQGAVAVLDRPTTEPDVVIENLNINGVWDFTDPQAARKIAKDVSDAIDLVKKGYR